MTTKSFVQKRHQFGFRHRRVSSRRKMNYIFLGENYTDPQSWQRSIEHKFQTTRNKSDGRFHASCLGSTPVRPWALVFRVKKKSPPNQLGNTHTPEPVERTRRTCLVHLHNNLPEPPFLFNIHSTMQIKVSHPGSVLPEFVHLPATGFRSSHPTEVISLRNKCS